MKNSYGVTIQIKTVLSHGRIGFPVFSPALGNKWVNF